MVSTGLRACRATVPRVPKIRTHPLSTHLPSSPPLPYTLPKFLAAYSPRHRNGTCAPPFPRNYCATPHPLPPLTLLPTGTLHTLFPALAGLFACLHLRATSPASSPLLTRSWAVPQVYCCVTQNSTGVATLGGGDVSSHRVRPGLAHLTLIPNYIVPLSRAVALPFRHEDM